MKGPLSPHVQLRPFLPGEMHGALLEWTLAQEAAFQPAMVLGRRVDPGVRQALVLGDLGELDAPLRNVLTEALPAIFAGIGAHPFDPETLELELAAHGDGAHFTAHRDIATGAHRPRVGGDGSGRQDRLVSAVLYFHRQPQGFGGGALRLHRLGSDGKEGDYLDVQPLDNSLVAFPSWVTHEVRRVDCPSGQFPDYRFALNCWYCRAL